MDRNEICIIEQHLDRKVFLTSMNKRYHFWAMVDNDPDWMVQF